MAPENTNNLLIKTNKNDWLIPSDSMIFKQLVSTLSLKASDLKFDSDKEQHKFIKHLFLLALEDEYQSHSPSMIANFARELLSEHQFNMQ